jgi:hypothetical protein
MSTFIVTTISFVLLYLDVRQDLRNLDYHMYSKMCVLYSPLIGAFLC